MADLFATMFDTCQPWQALSGLQSRAPSQLAIRRLHQRHAGMARATGRRQATDRLFFAVRPDEETAAQIVERAQRWRAAHNLTGKPLEAGHVHVTLCHVGNAAGPPRPELIAALTERAAGVTMPAFRVEFDRVMSFRNGAFVLCGDDSAIGLEILQQRLSDVLDASPRPARRFVPHVTLLRDGRHVAEQPIERIGWTVREVVLVHSLLGQTIHRHVARVPLIQS